MNAFLNLPLWSRIVLIALGLVLLGAFALLIPSMSGKVLLVLGGGLVGVVVLLLLYALTLKLLSKRKSGVMSLALGKHNAGGGSISDAAQRAKLDDLRQVFENGVEKFNNAGKDLYSLPWYVVVGEPGSGKTEAIRHSNIGFPPGLQDELQGTGGTINMNWWFTNQAVFLDTAGRMLFEDVAPGSTNEWKEFLRLLKKARPNCPINGMILCIPSDTLIKDNQEELEAKSRKLASQLSDIQRALDVRFPVFVLVTKSDLVPGFREFFDGIHDPQLQHQMVGWSNPRPLDEPFHPDELEKLLDSYLAELYRRRLGLVEDPNPVQIGGRRIDEVDSCFTYPSALQGIFPRLKRYLETIFAAGEWAQKPLFLRGIYFTSSLQEGSALDEELANALDLPLDELPEGKVWEKERAYFLRDVCRDKVFKESRLVTRATNAKKQLRQRQMILFWTGVACLLGLAAFAYYGSESLKNSVGEQLQYWRFLEREIDLGDSFVPAAVYEGREAGTYINNATGSIELESGLTTVEGYHAKLRELAEQEVEVPGFLKFLFLGGADQDSRLKAQRVAFEKFVIQPLLRYSREKLMNLDRDSWDDSATEALAALLRLEKKIADREQGIPPDPLEPVALINPLMDFLTGKPAGTLLPDILNETYFSTEIKGADAAWPPSWASGGNSVRQNEPILEGVQTYMDWVQRQENERLEGLTRISQAFERFESLERAELVLINEMSALENSNDLDDVMEAYEAYLKQKNEVDREIGVLTEVFPTDQRKAFSLYDAYRNGVASSLGNIEAAVNELMEKISGTPGVLETQGESGGGMESYPLFGEVTRILENRSRQFSNQVTQGLSEEALAEIREFDNTYLAPEGIRETFSYRVRADLYRLVLVQFLTAFGEPEPALGSLEASLAGPMDLVDELLHDIKDYGGGLGSGFREGTSQVLNFLAARKFAEFGSDYADMAAGEIKGDLGFPVVRDRERDPLTVEEIRSLRDKLTAFQNDTNSEVMSRMPEDTRQRLEILSDSFASLGEMTKTYITEAGNPRRATLSFPSEPHQREFLETFFPEESFNAIFGGRSFRDLSFGGRERIRAYQAESVDLAQLALDTDFFAIDFFQLADSETPEETLKFEGAWAPLDFVIENRSIRAEPKLGENFELGELWHVLLQLPARGEKPLVVVVSVKFSQAIPALEEWPRLGNLPF